MPITTRLKAHSINHYLNCQTDSYATERDRGDSGLIQSESVSFSLTRVAAKIIFLDLFETRLTIFTEFDLVNGPFGSAVILSISASENEPICCSDLNSPEHTRVEWMNKTIPTSCFAFLLGVLVRSQLELSGRVYL